MKIPTEVRLCWDFFLGGAVVSTAPTEQKCTNRAEVHQPSRSAPTAQKCTNRAEVHQPSKNRTNRAEMHRLLGWCSRDCCTPRKAPIELTIRGYVGVRGYGRDAIPSYNSSP